jgi:hypothetical protein
MAPRSDFGYLSTTGLRNFLLMISWSLKNGVSKKNSEHHFTLNGSEYKVRIHTLHRAKYHFKTFLMKGDEILIEQEVKEISPGISKIAGIS